MEIQNDEKIVINQLRHVPEVWNQYMRDYHKKRMDSDEEYKAKRQDKLYISKQKQMDKIHRERQEKILNGWIPPKMGRKKKVKPDEPNNNNNIV
jgi:hypothetical protein